MGSRSNCLSGNLEIVVLNAGTSSTYPLPREGTVTIGRSDDNDIVLRDPSVSRRHAILHLSGALSVEDVGSANGLVIQTPEGGSNTSKIVQRDVPYKGKSPIRIGEAIRAGATLLIIQPREEEEEPPSSRLITSFTTPVVHDPATHAAYEVARRAAKSDLNVLLLGETGVGKEVMAETIHHESRRAGGPLVSLNCAALTENLLESELFGHESGAFTGAARAKPGLFETANGGTLFLDEVGELPHSIQVKLLRVLEERKVLRVGGLQKRKIDVRIIAATNRDLENEEVREALFRNDLYYRLNGVSIRIPPLRERVADIMPLARLFLARAIHGAKHDILARRFSSDAVLVLEKHSWPGNIRELRNVIDRAALFATTPIIEPWNLGIANDQRDDPTLIQRASGTFETVRPLSRPSEPPSSGGTWPPISMPLRSKKGEEERLRIVAALQQCAGNQTEAAALLGISRRTLVSRLDDYGIERPRKAQHGLNRRS